MVNFVRGETRSIFSEATKNALKRTNFEIDAPIYGAKVITHWWYYESTEEEYNIESGDVVRESRPRFFINKISSKNEAEKRGDVRLFAPMLENR